MDDAFNAVSGTDRIELMQTFVRIVEAGSLSAAATQLGTSQPTLSRQIATLEAQLGTPLFQRGARRLQPTPAALALADPAQRMLAAVQACALAADAVGTAADDLAGTVRLTASEVVSAQVLPADDGATRIAPWLRASRSQLQMNCRPEPLPRG